MYTNRGLENVLHSDLRKISDAIDTTAVASIDSILSSEFKKETGQDTTPDLNASVTMESFRNGDIQRWLQTAATIKEEQLQKETDPEKRSSLF